MNKKTYSDYVVMKFGGTSVGSPERIKEVAGLISGSEPKIVVLSAMSGVTNTLVEISRLYAEGNARGALALVAGLEEKYCKAIDELYSKEATKEGLKNFVLHRMNFIRKFQEELFTDFEEKQVLSLGEIISVRMMAAYLNESGKSVTALPALDFVVTDKYGEPNLKIIRERLSDLLATYPDQTLFLTEGYICKNAYAEIDNLKRGGSDYTATIIGACIDAKEIQIWTDIDGLHNNDPRVVEHTSPVRELHFSEAAELAYFGAKILHPSCILPAQMANIPIRLLNTFEPSAPGTLISNRIDEGCLKAVAIKDGITVLRINSNRRFTARAFLRRVFEAFEKFQTPIDIVSTSEVAVSVGIDSTHRLEELLIELRNYGEVSPDNDMSVICIAGDLNWKNAGFEGAILQALEDIPIRMISYGGSNHNVSVVIRTEDKVRALRLLSKHLFGEAGQ